jgi:hypothetical protein
MIPYNDNWVKLNTSKYSKIYCGFQTKFRLFVILAKFPYFNTKHLYNILTPNNVLLKNRDQVIMKAMQVKNIKPTEKNLLVLNEVVMPAIADDEILTQID